MGCVYLWSCKENGKKYVGQHHKDDPKKRTEEHFRAAEKGKPYTLYNAIRKYGREAFTIEVLCVCTNDSLDNIECYYAEQFETYVWDSPGGYNMVWCGNSPRRGLKNSPEAIEKTRQAQLGKKRSPEACEKIRQGKLGKKQSPEHIEKIRQANILLWERRRLLAAA